MAEKDSKKKLDTKEKGRGLNTSLKGKEERKNLF